MLVEHRSAEGTLSEDGSMVGCIIPPSAAALVVSSAALPLLAWEAA